MVIADTVAQPAGNYYDKYNARNPIARMLMSGFLETFDRLSQRTNARDAHEIGCGEGHLSLRLAAQGISVRGCDIAPAAVEEAQRNGVEKGHHVPFRLASIYDLRPPADRAELVVCCEVLEHLPDPHRAVEILSRLASPWLLASVPREPIWRILNVCRGKYLADLGNTPGHVQHWSTLAFSRLLETRFEIVEMARPLPWSMALCRVKSGR